jgi:hypothetical protein
MRFIALELREHMAALGFRRVKEMIGRSDMLEMLSSPSNPKTALLDYERYFLKPNVPENWRNEKRIDARPQSG